jgi:hypothetical protein
MLVQLSLVKQGMVMAKPANSWRNKGVDIAAWRDDNGRCSFTLRKQYLNKQTQTWTDTKYLYPDDLRALRDLLDLAIAWNSGNAADRREHEYAAAASGAEAMAAKIASGADVKFEDDEDQIPF